MSEEDLQQVTASTSNSTRIRFTKARILEFWQRVRLRLIKTPPEFLTRIETAYLATFLDSENLEKLTSREAAPNVVLASRGLVAVWLPGNVSLLGPLTLALLSLADCPVWLKTATGSRALTADFLDFAVNGASEDESAWLNSTFRVEAFSRESPKGAEWASQAMVRIIFGSDAAAQAIEQNLTPAGSLGIHFRDHVSQAWFDPQTATDQDIENLIKVFTVYGKAGCTSPQQVVLLDADLDAAREFAQRIKSLWSRAVKGKVSQIAASKSLLAAQYAKIQGFETMLCENNSLCLALSDQFKSGAEFDQCLPIIASSTQTAIESLPENIQTVGYAMAEDRLMTLRASLAETNVLRLTPVAKMHEFGTRWDGYDWWRKLFVEKVFD